MKIRPGAFSIAALLGLFSCSIASAQELQLRDLCLQWRADFPGRLQHPQSLRHRHLHGRVPRPHFIQRDYGLFDTFLCPCWDGAISLSA
jgi:hypothetical protein